MLLKLAKYFEKNQEKEISLCCAENNSNFFSIKDNIFAISDFSPHKKTTGSESKGEDVGIKNETFVKIYQCSLEREKKKYFFKHLNPYEGLILDNQFFLNILLYCRKKSIRIKDLSYQTNYNTNTSVKEIDEIDEIVDDINKNDELRIKKLTIDISSIPIFFNKLGYIEIGSSEETIWNETIEMIKIGFEDNVIS